VFTKFAAVLALYLSIVVRLAGMAAGRRRRKRMKFVHTADWQIGLCATQAGNAGERIRQERLKAAERVVAATRDAGAEFLLLAGDTFEHNAVDRASVQQVGDILARSDCPVFLIPGNHDPLVPGSVWEHPVWQTANLHVLRQAEPVDVGSAVLYPCPLKEGHGRRDPTTWITPDVGGRVRIGLAHGHVEGLPQMEPDYPIARDAAQRAGLNYLALGHWHSYVAIPDAQGVVRMAYSGTHETTKFGERDSGNVLVVEIAGPGEPPVIQAVRTSCLSWYDMSQDLRLAGQIEELLAELNALPEPKIALVSIRLTGLIFAGDLPRLEQLRDIVASNRFLFARLDDFGMHLAPEDAAWVEALPEGILRTAAMRLRELADPAFAGVRPGNATAETAANALMELYALAREVSA
jgi:predicted phosphodiesterase